MRKKKVKEKQCTICGETKPLGDFSMHYPELITLKIKKYEGNISK